MPTEFYKMSGSGNDFVMLDGRVHRVADWPADRIVEVCDRRQGVGADGFVILTPVGPAQVRMGFYNSDGSEAAMCGNAALCSTVLATYLGMVSPSGMELVTGAGTFPTRCTSEPFQASLNLPDFSVPKDPAIPMVAGEVGIWLTTVGVPHLTVLVHDVEKVDLAARGRELRFHPGAGPGGANVNFAAIASGDSSRWLMRTYERGVEGETLACGTGAVATAVALTRAGQGTIPSTVVSRSGKPLEIRASFDRPGWVSQVWLTGEGRLVYRGILTD